MLTLYALPSIAALSLKLTIFWFGRNSLSTASLWLWLFLLGLFGMNLVELIGFYYVEQPEKGIIWLSGYYIFAELAFLSLVALSLENANRLSGMIKLLVALFFIVGVIPLIVPGLALDGAKSIGYSVTRIPGPYYFIVQIAILLPLMGSVCVSGYYALRGKSHSVRRKSQILLISCIPIFSSVILVMAAMQMGYAINASVVLSLMITITLLILIATEHKENQYKFMSLIPKTKEHIFVKQLSNLIVDPTIGLDQGRELIEQEMIKEALILSSGNKIKAASILGISRQTLQRKMDKLLGVKK